MEALPHFNVNAETTLQMDTSRKGPGANLIRKGKNIPVTDTFSRVTPMDPEDDITTRNPTHISAHILMNVQPQDSLSNKLDRLRKSTAQGNQLTRLSPYINTGFRVISRVYLQIFTNIGTTGKHYQHHPLYPGHLS